MKGEMLCIGCKKWERCSRAGLEYKCKKYQSWIKRMKEYRKREGIS